MDYDMNEEKQIQMVQISAEEAEEQKKSAKRAKIKKYIIIGIVFIFLFVCFTIYNKRIYNSFKESNTMPITDVNDTKYEKFAGGLLKYNQDGIVFLDQNMQVKWNGVYSMDQPELSIADTTFVLADTNGNQVCIFDQNGEKTELSMPYPIKHVIAANQGLFCVVLQDNETNYIRIYDKKGNIISDIKTSVGKNGYPMSVAFSKDGSKLVASYYKIDGIHSSNVLSFYNFGSGGQGQGGNLVGSFQMEENFVPRVVFLDNDMVCAVGSNETIFYKMKEKPVEKRKIEYDEDIESIFFSEEYVGFLREQEETVLENGEKTAPYCIDLYNHNGKKVSSFEQSQKSENIMIDQKEIITILGSQCDIYELNGRKIFSKDLGSDIVQWIPLDQKHSYLWIGNKQSSIIKLSIDLKERMKKVK